MFFIFMLVLDGLHLSVCWKNILNPSKLSSPTSFWFCSYTGGGGKGTNSLSYVFQDHLCVVFFFFFKDISVMLFCQSFHAKMFYFISFFIPW